MATGIKQIPIEEFTSFKYRIFLKDYTVRQLQKKTGVPPLDNATSPRNFYSVQISSDIGIFLHDRLEILMLDFI